MPLGPGPSLGTADILGAVEGQDREDIWERNVEISLKWWVQNVWAQIFSHALFGSSQGDPCNPLKWGEMSSKAPKYINAQDDERSMWAG